MADGCIPVEIPLGLENQLTSTHELTGRSTENSQEPLETLRENALIAGDRVFGLPCSSAARILGSSPTLAFDTRLTGGML